LFGNLVGVLLVCCALVPLPVAARDPVAVLERMAEASRQLNYDGVFVYRRADASDSMRIIHRAAAEGEVERVVSLSGSSREVIRDGHGVRCFLPQTGEMSLSRGFARPLMPTEITRPWARLSEFYTFNVAGEDRVAGRSSEVIEVTPRTSDRYGYRFWTDRATGLLLRSELLNRDGLALEQVEFVRLEFPDRIEDTLLQPGEGGRASAEDAVASGSGIAAGAAAEVQESGEARWKAAWLPVGFRLERMEMLSDERHQSPFQVMAYTDGLTVLSVFVEALADAPAAPSGFAVLGAAVAFTTRSGEHSITVVGEAPPLTVRRIAEGMTLAD
jgi:sigma-E factor negative regulatory protein RseB